MNGKVGYVPEAVVLDEFGVEEANANEGKLFDTYRDTHMYVEIHTLNMNFCIIINYICLWKNMLKMGEGYENIKRAEYRAVWSYDCFLLD